jgi:hypothetical protein
MSISNLLDMAFLSVIMLCAGDALRQLHALQHPIRSIAFGLVTIGSFGWIVHYVDGTPLPWWAFMALHAGFAIYAILLFVARNLLRKNDHGHYSGPDRRSARPTV